ncbi:MAG TPA: c-type cytochrome domain-containing protein, partial [Planctomycetia bacterium]|nr:c-type cytochrome domain-containing protein [Planctomycetia bacterium]
MRLSRSSHPPLVAAACFSLLFVSAGAADDEEAYFENEIRPLLVARCLKCHGEKKQEAGLRLDSRAAMLKGGDSGPAVVPGKASSSLLLEAVRQEGDLKMPPDKPLAPREIELLARWIERGAKWPAAAQAQSTERKPHWAFQPVRNPSPPSVRDL